MSKKAIIITGTPGTGKTELTKKLSLLLKKKAIFTTEYAKKHSLFEKFDKKRGSYIVNTKKLTSFLTKDIEKSEDILLIEGHLSHFLPSKYVLLCLVCKTDLPTLKKRLETRGYNEDKVRENLDSEIFDICLNEALELGHIIEEVNTSKSIKTSTEIAIKAIKKHNIIT